MVFRALIIDDEETYARALGRVLGRRGIETDWAPSCAAGLGLIGIIGRWRLFLQE